MKDIGAIAWYNAIEENLNSMGYQCGFKFYSKPNQSLLTRWNGSSRMSLNWFFYGIKYIIYEIFGYINLIFHNIV